jgi:hypothetical protein
MIGYQDSDGGTTVFPGADEFFPPFLLLLIRTNPPHLVSTIEYCCQLMEGSWSEHPDLEILLSHLEACKQFVLTCTFAPPRAPQLHLAAPLCTGNFVHVTLNRFSFGYCCRENSFTGDAQELKRLLQRAEEEVCCPFPLSSHVCSFYKPSHAPHELI